jgi:uncharacterized protein (DUF4415 family)
VLLEQPDGSYRPVRSRTDRARVRARATRKSKRPPPRTPTHRRWMRHSGARAASSPPAKSAGDKPACGTDEDVLASFRPQGRGDRARLNAVLRAYVEARRREAK